uniref:Uncharacterized protein LOC111126812 n=1 Tax=Crassostrea virginica TaxID=6565 RepID=A0A8B8DKA9_CRAVI|nr:uncharacterized protein LOC111126812 [Crassostrea virginica]
MTSCLAINSGNCWPKIVKTIENFLTFYQAIEKAIKSENLVIRKILSGMVETDHNSFFGKGPRTTDTSLGARTTEAGSVRVGGECQRPHSRGKQKISRDEE